WAELVLAWACGHHLAAVVGTPDSSGTGRSLLSDLTRRDGVRTRRGSLLRVLRASPTLEATEESLAAALAWAFPLVPTEVIQEETAALLLEGEVLGVIADGALTVLGQELVLALDEEITSADERLASALHEAAPAPVEEVLLDADLTVVIPGRAAEVSRVLQAVPEAAPLGLHRLAPAVAVTLSDPGFALQVSRQAGLSPQAVGPDGRPVAEELTHSLRGGPVEADLVTIDGPELK